MRDQTEFLAEIYDRYEKNKRSRNKKYIKTAVSFCLFAILGTAALPILNQPKKSEETAHFTNETDMPNTYSPILTPTSGNKDHTSGSAVSEEKTENLWERLDFGTIEENTEETATTAASQDIKDISHYCIEFSAEWENKFKYPFSAAEIAAVTLRNGKGGTYTIASEKNIDIFYEYFCRNGAYFVPFSANEEDIARYTVEFQCHLGESKIFYVKGLEKNVLSLMKALKTHE